MWRVAFRFSEWLREVSRRHENVERMERAAAALPGRKRPRDPEVEDFLRKRGAPEELMGPERERDS
jgi:hypothetical protein